MASPMRTAESLGLASCAMATRGALQYMRVHAVEIEDMAVLNRAIADRVHAALPVAMRDAREALDCGMEEAAEQTFAASMVLAGIAAVKGLLPAEHGRDS